MKLRHLAPTALALLSAALVAARGQTITGFGDLNYWGSGPNHSAFVIAWNDGKASDTIAWGFSWSAGTSVAGMLTALAAQDTRLFARIDSATGFGLGVFGLGYDTNGSGSFSVTGAVDTLGNATTPVFLSGISNLNTDSATTQSPQTSINAGPADIADHYVEGWNDHGFWEFFTGGASASYPTSWTSSMSGASDTMLVNNGWYALSITQPNYDSNIPGAAVAAVPEPGTLALLGLGTLAVLIHVKRRIHAS